MEKLFFAGKMNVLIILWEENSWAFRGVYYFVRTPERSKYFVYSTPEPAIIVAALGLHEGANGLPGKWRSHEDV